MANGYGNSSSGRSNRNTNRRGMSSNGSGRTQRTNTRMTPNRNNRNNMNQCPPGHHWMPPVNGKPGFCMDNNDPAMSNRTQRAPRQQSSRVVERQRQNNLSQRTSAPSRSGLQRQTRPQAARYYYESTGEPYSGRTVMKNGTPYSTTGSTMNGNGQRLTRTPMRRTPNTRQAPQQRNTTTTQRTMRNTRGGGNRGGGSGGGY
jgi:hypothetical protein